MDEKQLLADLNPMQREAVIYTEGPLLILAGAGSGKTRAITYRIAYLLQKGVNPWNILAMTFTNKAAGEMKERVNLLAGETAKNVWVSTFHSFCARILRLEAQSAGLNKDFVIYDDDDSKKVIEICLKELNQNTEKIKPAAIAEMISSAKDQLLDPESYMVHAMTQSELIKRVVADVYELYQKKLDLANALDFGDLQMLAVGLFKSNQQVLEKYQERFKYIMIDEYQDTNHAQYVLTKLLAGKYRNICVVGDDDQAIYSWRGADVRNILEFENDYPDAKVVSLEQNYRSTKNILDYAGKVIHYNHHRKPKKLWTEKEEGDEVVYTEYATELEEASGIAQKIKSFVESGECNLSDFAVFYRVNAQSRSFEEIFTRMGIPFIIVGSLRFYERMEIKDIIAYLKLVNNPADDISFKRIINVPARGIGKTTLVSIENYALEKDIPMYFAAKEMFKAGQLKKAEQFINLVEGLLAQKTELSASEIAKIVIEQTGYMSNLEVQNDIEAKVRIENIKELVSAIADFENSPDTEKTLAAFLENIALISDLDLWDGNSEFVTFITLHLAKGLEFENVFITGLEEGLFPLANSSYTISELEEERRLCYVGMTRAKKRLFLSSAAQRRIYGQMKWNIPSRFVREAGITQQVKSPSARYIDTVTEHPVYKTGVRVRHAEFGCGKIIDVSGTGDDLKVIVQFDSGIWKKLYVKYANLEKI